MRRRRWPRTVRAAVVVAVIALPVSLLLVACGSATLTGAWMTEKGSLTFTSSGDSAGYQWDPHATKPAGGVIVVDNGGTYHVTLVSADGQRFLAAQAAMRDKLLHVRISSGERSPAFFLSPVRDGRCQLIADFSGKPRPQEWSIDLVPGSLTAASQASSGQ